MDLMDTPQSKPSDETDPRGASRRRFLELLAWSSLSLLVATAFPALTRFLKPRRLGARRDRIAMGPLDDYRSAGVSTRWVSRHGVWLVHHEGRLIALEARCTHLGCKPEWNAGRGVFRCPCHGSRFAPDGQVLTGPATEALHRYAIRVERNEVVVDRSLPIAWDEAEGDTRFFVRLDSPSRSRSG